ncbi:MAG TPA: MiaB/RimO family radical SAM methylthiotransferase [Candidatus Paceibacterota bacterium]|nr:MiaB/RimO family radical SAM methylthiotransferase [Candidatus Pacearchaeota archaeon]HRZ50525.1 MiaB/RimO family radical SAM methylthiotransferase [Candidatus Paceibacterota bacterium]HSA36246.1 MiaB/RimO family radical SAM methylthiotransferase [Candidatus Paceibacterota bacterium]
MQYYIITYGCQMNHSDSERIADHLEAKGIPMAESLEKADMIIVNMCSVRQASVDRVFGLSDRFRALRTAKPGLITVLTGCIVKTDKKKFDKIFDRVVEINSFADWLDSLAGVVNSETKPEAKRNTKISVGIPITTGCDNFCAYCVVPYTRGPLISRDWRIILEEVEKRVEKGAKEIWLLGQNVNNYHFDGVDFAQLIEKANAIPGDFWIRFTSPHPKDFNDAAVKAVASCVKVTPYFNLAVQSGDDTILKAMARPYTAKQYIELVDKIRQAFRECRTGIESTVALSTDVIVGFPGETEDQFLNTAALFKKIGFDMAYIARYSPRSGTAAAKLSDDVSESDKEHRFLELTKILFATSQRNNEKYVGTVLPVLVNKVFEKEGRWASGKTRSYKTVKFRLDKGIECAAGDIVNVRITEALPLGLGAKLP